MNTVSRELAALTTPCLLVDYARLEANVLDMSRRLAAHGVRFRPHVKTHKCVPIAELMRRSAPHFVGITVSTLREAEYFAAAGFHDILYGVSIFPGRFERAAELLRDSVRLTLILDDLEIAAALHQFLTTERLRAAVMIELDVDGHRAGLEPKDPAVLELARLLDSASLIDFRGVMTHAGESYLCRGVAEIAEHAERERAGVVQAANAIREAGVVCHEVSVGSTPTARYARDLSGVTEVRPGVFAFYDLVQAGIGACQREEIALSVLTTVIGHKRSHRRLLIDAGALALSKDRGTAQQPEDFGFGVVIDADTGLEKEGLVVTLANQEHGIIDLPPELMLEDFPIGTRLRILPNHACMTAAAHDHYHVLSPTGTIVADWGRCNRW
ncbi:MAG: alanine racemase [Haliea sp.]|uniref:alanine racemase n=1 Tax=Marinobacter salarius TaxID=1420917 RepID=UPI0032EB717C